MTDNTRGRTRRTLQRAGALGAVLALSTVAWASPALAGGMSQSTAQALNATLLGGTVASTGTSTAQNDGTLPLVTKTFTNPIAALPGQTVANTGAVSQTANASNAATSSACAGLVGSGGALTIGNDGSCSLAGATAPLLVNLGTATLTGIPLPVNLRLAATAIYSQCTAGPSGTGPYSASSTLAGVRLLATTAGTLGLPGLNLDIPINIGSPIELGVLAPLLKVAINQTSAVGPTSSATALSITAIGGGLANVTIGKVTCGENATVSDIPMVPLKGAGVAGLTALVVGAGYLTLRRRTTSLA
jgi:hypothetical protein